MGEPAVAMERFNAWRRDAPAPVIDHRRFGPVRASLRPESEAFMWECLDLIGTQRGPADLEFEAGAWGPTADHEHQLDAVVADLDSLTNAAAQMVSIQIGERSDLEWQGARLTGRTGAFRLHFWCKAETELLVTVSFEQFRPRRVELHA